MKAIFILTALFLVSHFEGSQAQDDYDSRLVAFLNKTLADFPNWLIRLEYEPYPLYPYGGGGNFTLTSADENNMPHYDLTGQVSERYYHGAVENMRALNIVSTHNLPYFNFTVDIGYGDGENSFIEANYTLDGKIRGRPVHGNGKLRRTNHRTTPQWMNATCSIRLAEWNPKYFDIKSCHILSRHPEFQDFTLHGLQFAGGSWEITPLVEAWYMGHFRSYELPNMGSNYMTYMIGVFYKTPVDDIIGSHLAPASSPRKLSKSLAVSHEQLYDEERKEWVSKSSFNF